MNNREAHEMLINITGIDGCGKSLQIQLLENYIRSKGKEVFISKAYGKAEKDTFSAYIETVEQEALLFLFQAFHIRQFLRAEEAIEKRKIVIADRWDESYIVYHSQRGILAHNRVLREKLNKIAFKCTIPDFTFLLDVPVEVAQRRTHSRGADFFDKKPADYHEMMRRGYLNLAQERKWHVLDGNRSVEILHKEVVNILEPKLWA